MISVIIPVFNARNELPATLGALVPATIDGLVREVIIVDGGSCDDSLRIAEDAGARIISSPRGRGQQLARGGREARGPWLLFLHADTVLEHGWGEEVTQFINTRSKAGHEAAAFRFALNDKGLAPRFVEFMVGLRSHVFKLPYGDQGLLIHRNLYDEIGGYADLPLMEDVAIVRAIGARRLHILASRARTSAVRYRTDGYIRRIARNLFCLGQYFAGVDPAHIARTYDPQYAQNTPPEEQRDVRS